MITISQFCCGSHICVSSVHYTIYNTFLSIWFLVIWKIHLFWFFSYENLNQCASWYRHYYYFITITITIYLHIFCLRFIFFCCKTYTRYYYILLYYDFLNEKHERISNCMSYKLKRNRKFCVVFYEFTFFICFHFFAFCLKQYEFISIKIGYICTSWIAEQFSKSFDSLPTCVVVIFSVWAFYSRRYILLYLFVFYCQNIQKDEDRKSLFYLLFQN